MIETPPLRTLLLENGISLRFYDAGNRYFGDFHRVLIVVEGVVDMGTAALSEQQRAALAALPDPVLFRRDLERMGVTSERLRATACELIDSFLASARGYLERPDMPGRLLEKRLADKKRRRSLPGRHR
jgi:hypothetical protein